MYNLPAQVVVVVGEDLFSRFDDPDLMYCEKEVIR